MPSAKNDETVLDQHLVLLEDLCKRLETNTENGLTEKVANRRLALDGPNIIPPPSNRSLWSKFPFLFIAVFSVSSAWCFFRYAYSTETSTISPETTFRCGVICSTILTLAITAYLTCFRNKTPHPNRSYLEGKKSEYVFVIRDCKMAPIDSRRLVVGDVIELNAGDPVPADLRMFWTDGKFAVDESCLTGESEPRLKSEKCTSTNPLETENLAFFTATVVGGTGRGVVISTGAKTVMGRIAHLSAVLEMPKN